MSVQAENCRSCPFLSSLGYNGSLVIWTVVRLIAAKFKSLVLFVPGFALSNIANIYVSYIPSDCSYFSESMLFLATQYFGSWIETYYFSVYFVCCIEQTNASIIVAVSQSVRSPFLKIGYININDIIQYWNDCSALCWTSSHIENDGSNNSSIVACVFITSVMFLPSRCLTTIRGFLPNRAVA
jgi:hypothetical protein